MNSTSVVREIPELTSTRCIAALCVVVSHLHGLGFISAPALHDFLDGGRPAVSFFFILSGFIMNRNYPSLRGSATKRYMRSRLARLYPTVILSLMIALPAGLYMAATSERAHLLTL
jgi:peptidoglycan/LPS O-acetylase OafA/YrhL